MISKENDYRRKGMNPRVTVWGIHLSTRSGQVLSLIMEGNSNAEIARDLGMKEKTVKWHISKIFEHPSLKKYKIKRRSQLIVLLYDRKLS